MTKTGDSWFSAEEVFLSKMEKQCNSYNKYYSKEFAFYNKLSSRFNIPILIISAANALTAVGLNSFVRQEYVSVMNAILSAGTGVLGSIQLYLKLNEKMTKALSSSMLMKRLAPEDIQGTQHRPPTARHGWASVPPRVLCRVQHGSRTGEPN